MRWFLVLLAVPAFVAAFVAFFAATWQYAATKAAADLLNSTFILTSQPNGRFALNARRGIADRLAWWAAGCMIGASILTVGLNAMERTVQGTNGRRAIEMKAQEKTTKSGGQQSTDAIAQAEDPRQYNGF